MKVEKGPGWEIRLGDFREVATGIAADCMICDPPYLGARGESWESENVPLRVPYEPATFGLLADVCAVHVKGWRVVFNDHPGFLAIRNNFRASGLVSPENPVPWCKPAGAYTPTGSANSPAKSADFICVARPRGLKETRQRPGHYASQPYSPCAEIFHTGGKPLSLMREIIRHYSNPGDLVFDPCSGGATTLLAAVIEGRTAIGCEKDPDTFARSVSRMRNGYTPDMFPDFDGSHA